MLPNLTCICRITYNCVLYSKAQLGHRQYLRVTLILVISLFIGIDKMFSAQITLRHWTSEGRRGWGTFFKYLFFGVGIGVWVGWGCLVGYARCGCDVSRLVCLFTKYRSIFSGFVCLFTSTSLFHEICQLVLSVRKVFVSF